MTRRVLTGAFLAALGLLAALKMEQGADPDLFWQLKDGELIVTQGRLPVREEFSFTAQGKPMVAIEWGAEAVSFLVFRLGGYAGLSAFHAGLFAAVFALLLALLRRRLPPAESLCLLCLAAFAFLNFYAARAQNWTFLFTALFLYWAALWEDGADWAPWAMAALMPLWANLHGGFMLGLALLGLLCLRRAWESRRAAALAPLGLGAALCCLHPNGATGLIYPLWFMAFPPPGRALIQEWQPLDFADKTAAPYLLVLALLLWLGMTGIKRRFPWALWTVVLAVLALRGRKLLPEFTMSALAVMAFRLGPAPSRFRRAVLAAAALLSLGAAGWVVLERPWPKPLWDLERGYPRAAAEFIAARYPGQRVFHHYDWGGYLIYKLYPKNQVFIDGRLDPYWGLLPGDYSVLRDAGPGWQNLIEDYRITLALLKPEDRLHAELLKDRAWKPVLADGRSVLLARRRLPEAADPPRNLGVFAPSRLESVLGQDGVTPIPVKTPDGRKFLLWTFGDTILGDWKGPVVTTATVNFSDAAELKAMPPNTAAWTVVPSSAPGLRALRFHFFKTDGEIAQPIPYAQGEDPFVKRLWAGGGVQVADTAYLYYMDIDLEREKGPMAFRPLGTGLARARVGRDFPEGGLRVERVPGFNLTGLIVDAAALRDGYIYLAARAARAGDANFNALCFLRVEPGRIEDAGAYERLLPSGRWGAGRPALFFADMGGEVSLSWDAGRKEYSVFYMSSREQAVKFLRFRDFRALARGGAVARSVYSPPAKPGALYYSAKEIRRDEEQVHVIYMDPSIYQPVLVSFARDDLYPRTALRK